MGSYCGAVTRIDAMLRSAAEWFPMGWEESEAFKVIGKGLQNSCNPFNQGLHFTASFTVWSRVITICICFALIVSSSSQDQNHETLAIFRFFIS